MRKLAGMEYAYAHQSVNKGVSPKKVYKAISDAVRNDPFRTNLKTEAKRVEALQFAFDRIQRLGQRFREDYRVSVSDHTRMEKEFEYLKGRIQTIASAKLYDEFARVTEVDNPLGTNARYETFRAHLDQLMDATFAGVYQQDPENMTEILTTLKKVALGRFEGDISNEIQLEFEGKRGWFSRHIPVVRTIMEFTDTIDHIPRHEDADDEEAWFNEAKNITRQMVIENPAKIVATHTDGIERTGRILVDLLGQN